MFRIVADDTPRPLWRASACDDTGSPVATYSRTSTANSRRDRSESSWETIARQMLRALPIIAWRTGRSRFCVLCALFVFKFGSGFRVFAARLRLVSTPPAFDQFVNRLLVNDRGLPGKKFGEAVTTSHPPMKSPVRTGRNQAKFFRRDSF